MAKNNKKPLVSIISINYNNLSVTLDMIKSLSNLSYPNYEVIVVDNGSSESPLEIRDHDVDLLVCSPDNLGFAGGNNLGIRHSSGEYILLLNNDVTVDPEFIEPLVELLENNADAGAVSPKILYHEEPEIIQYAGHPGLNTLTGRGFTRGYGQVDDGSYNDIREVSLLHGAAMMIRRSLISEIGGMTEKYFLYYEEIDYCERIKRAGYKLYYNGTSRIYHKESITVGKDSPLKVYYLNRNRILFLRYNTQGVRRACAIAFFAFVSFPRNLFNYLIKGDTDRMFALIRGVGWHFNLMR